MNFFWGGVVSHLLLSSSGEFFISEIVLFLYYFYVAILHLFISYHFFFKLSNVLVAVLKSLYIYSNICVIPEYVSIGCFFPLDFGSHFLLFQMSDHFLLYVGYYDDMSGVC